MTREARSSGAVPVTELPLPHFMGVSTARANRGSGSSRITSVMLERITRSLLERSDIRMLAVRGPT